MSPSREMVEERLQPLAVTPWDQGDAATGTEDRLHAGDRALSGESPARPAIITVRPVRAGLQFLRDSRDQAQEFLRDPWEFAVEWAELQRLGVNCNDVRWLIHRGLVEHANEITGMEDEHRRFVPCSSLSLSGRCCFIITETGIRYLHRSTEHSDVPGAADARSPAAILADPEAADGKAPLLRVVPKWDRDRRQLRVGAKIVKEYKVPAPNQEIILAVFEEEQWPPKIDDPLPHQGDIDPQRRLHDTINSLNRRQRHRLVHFGADGLGQGVRWEMLTKQLCREA